MKLMRGRRILFLLIAIPFAFAFAPGAEARVGGGDSYSGGGGGSSGGSGDGGGEIIYLLFRFLFWLTLEYPAIGIPVDIVVILFLIKWFRKSNEEKTARAFAAATSRVGTSDSKLPALRKFDPHFSEVTFRDFCYSLYARAHHARGSGKLAQYAPYLSEGARGTLASRGNIAEVRGIVIGSMAVGPLRGVDTPTVDVTVTFEANYTEVSGEREESWYVREQWVLERKRDILSPAPEKARADHCPRCGAALKTRSDGACDYCGVRIASGAFQWYVRAIALISKDARGPLLTSNVPEQGTARATVMQPGYGRQREAFIKAHPDFAWPAFEQQVRSTAIALQDAWTSREWEKARAYETDALFQTHRYWIDAYRRQKLRNVVDGYNVARVQAVRITTDVFYESITVRIWAEGRDYTIDDAGNVVAGSKTSLRQWTEYWTFVRSVSAASGAGEVACPNCGAFVVLGASGVCSYCGGRITAGTFDWMLSAIEQDEAYTG